MCRQVIRSNNARRAAALCPAEIGDSRRELNLHRIQCKTAGLFSQNSDWQKRLRRCKTREETKGGLYAVDAHLTKVCCCGKWQAGQPFPAGKSRSGKS